MKITATINGADRFCRRLHREDPAGLRIRPEGVRTIGDKPATVPATSEDHDPVDGRRGGHHD
jgi:hypothetical protein